MSKEFTPCELKHATHIKLQGDDQIRLILPAGQIEFSEVQQAKFYKRNPIKFDATVIHRVIRDREGEYGMTHEVTSDCVDIPAKYDYLKGVRVRVTFEVIE
jgi:hypothetical protein